MYNDNKTTEDRLGRKDLSEALGMILVGGLFLAFFLLLKVTF